MKRPWSAWAGPLLICAIIVAEMNWAFVADGPVQSAIKWPLRFLVTGGGLIFAIRSLALTDVLTRAALWPVNALLIWTVLGALWSVNDRVTSLISAAGLVSAWLFAMWFVTIYGWDRFAHTAGVACALFLGGGFVYGIVGGHDVAWTGGRLDGFANGPTAFGRIGAFAVVLAFPFLSRTSPHRRFGALLVALGVAAVVASQARTSFIAIAVALAFIAIRRAGRGGALIVALGLAAIGLTLGVAAAGGRADIVSRNNEDAGTLTGRTEIWDFSVELARERPLTGWGVSSGETVFTEAARSGEISWLAFTAHNAFLHMLVTLGVVGASLLVLVAAGFLRDASRSPSTYRDAVLLSVLVSGMTESLFDLPSLAVVLLAAGVAHGSNRALAHSEEQIHAKKRYKISPAALVTSSATSSRVRRAVR
jgi:O-antigen ligase